MFRDKQDTEIHVKTQERLFYATKLHTFPNCIHLTGFQEMKRCENSQKHLVPKHASVFRGVEDQGHALLKIFPIMLFYCLAHW